MILIFAIITENWKFYFATKNIMNEMTTIYPTNKHAGIKDNESDKVNEI